MRNFWGLTLFLSLASVVGIFFFLQHEFPSVEPLKTGYPAVHYRGKNSEPAVTIQRRPPAQWVHLSQVSKLAVGAIIVSEDWSFYTHPGYDLEEIFESFQRNILAGRYARGGSTITQQVVKNVFLDADKTLWRKFREIVLAIELDRALSKQKILEIYLNIAEWGEGIYGIHAAALHYFRKHPSQLTAREGAFLAMLLPSPKKYGVSHRQGELTPFARRRMRDIVRKMARAHYLAEADFSSAAQQRLAFERTQGGAVDESAAGEELDEETVEDEQSTEAPASVPVVELESGVDSAPVVGSGGDSDEGTADGEPAEGI